MNYETHSGVLGEAMEWHNYIHSDPGILAGKPVIKGTRLSVEFLLGLFASGWTEAQIFESYPHVTPEALQAVFAYAVENIQDVNLVESY